MRIYIIEILRFFFAICIMVYHAPIPYKIFNNSFLAVEFFFIISGYFTTKKLLNSSFDESPTLYCLKYTWNKFKKIIINCLLTIFLLLILYYFTLDWNIYILFQQTILHIYEGFLLSMTGIIGNYNNFFARPFWFLSALFIVTPLYSFLLVRHKELIKLTSIILPFFLYGLLIINFRNLNVWGESIFGIPLLSGILRCISGLLLGTFLYQLVELFKSFSFTKHQVVFMNINITVLLLLLLCTIIFFPVDLSCTLFACIIIFVVLILILSDKTYISHPWKKGGKISLFLGKISTHIYIIQCFTLPLTAFLIKDDMNKINLIYFIFTILFSFSFYFIIEKICHYGKRFN